ncbi:unnamed protein product [Dibothriocephalus latus]|uniref:Hexosyltransferase n=1 Tax=Dibothriocephalus latus TaxID=60516 RepID=A0A3P7MT50_DIBLA|nr:unnamed protein product [Dibothriocephalus latus]
MIATYTDTYQNLTLKTIVNLRFVQYNCLHSSPLFVFLDDDHGINVTQLHRVLSKYSVSELRRGIFGAIYPRSRVMRRAEHRWFTPIAAYPFPLFPTYANGPCYVIGADLIRKLSIASAFTRPLPNEDVYVGMMLFKLGVAIHPLPNMFIHKRLEATNAFPLVAVLKHFVRVLNIK